MMMATSASRLGDGARTNKHSHNVDLLAAVGPLVDEHRCRKPAGGGSKAGCGTQNSPILSARFPPRELLYHARGENRSGGVTWRDYINVAPGLYQASVLI